MHNVHLTYRNVEWFDSRKHWCYLKHSQGKAMQFIYKITHTHMSTMSSVEQLISKWWCYLEGCGILRMRRLVRGNLFRVSSLVPLSVLSLLSYLFASFQILKLWFFYQEGFLWNYSPKNPLIFIRALYYSNRNESQISTLLHLGVKVILIS